MSGLCKEQQIPGGNDRKKCKGNNKSKGKNKGKGKDKSAGKNKSKSKGNGSLAYVVSHPGRKERVQDGAPAFAVMGLVHLAGFGF